MQILIILSPWALFQNFADNICNTLYREANIREWFVYNRGESEGNVLHFLNFYNIIYIRHEN